MGKFFFFFLLTCVLTFRPNRLLFSKQDKHEVFVTLFPPLCLIRSRIVESHKYVTLPSFHTPVFK